MQTLDSCDGEFGKYGDVRPEYFRPPRSDAASQEFGVPLHEIHPASEMNDHNLLRNMLEDVEPGWEGHVLAGNCEYAEGEGDPDKINTASRLYALWERLHYISQLPITYLPPPSLADHEESDDEAEEDEEEPGDDEDIRSLTKGEKKAKAVEAAIQGKMLVRRGFMFGGCS